MDTQIQKIFFGQEIKMVDAALENYKIYADIDGYYYVKEHVGEVIHGKVLELTQEQIWIADQWEEVPKYLRKKVNIKLENGENKEVFIYEKSNVQCEIEINPDDTCNIPHEEVIKIAKDFKTQLKDISMWKSIRII